MNFTYIIIGLLLIFSGSFLTYKGVTSPQSLEMSQKVPILSTVNVNLKSLQSYWIPDDEYDSLVEYTKLKSKAKFYIISIQDNNEAFYKVGVTSKTVEERFKDLPYKYTIIHVSPEIDSRRAVYYEALVKRALKPYQYTPYNAFSGYTECFTHMLSTENLKELSSLSSNFLYKDKLNKLLRFK